MNYFLPPQITLGSSARLQSTDADVRVFNVLSLIMNVSIMWNYAATHRLVLLDCTTISFLKLIFDHVVIT